MAEAIQCSSYRYRAGALERARREINKYRSEIVANAQSGLSLSSARGAQQRPPVQKSQLTMDIQKALSELGYQPGVADGIYGARTKSAIQTFQRDIGISADGISSRELLNRLQAELEQRRAQGARAVQSNVIQPPKPQPKTVEIASFFTRGSHQDDVLRIQGTPTRIKIWKALGHETWYYGSSKVDIDIRTRKVLEWDNNGNLRVQL